MNQNFDRYFSIFIGVVIITYGVLGPYVLPSYQSFVEWLMGPSLVDKLKPIFNGYKSTKKDIYNMGSYLLYYPSYLTLHLGLVSILFRKDSKSRKIGIIAIACGLPMLAGLALIFYLLHIKVLYEIVIDTYQTFVSMPFILFIVEGGRLLDKNIDELIARKNKER